MQAGLSKDNSLRPALLSLLHTPVKSEMYMLKKRGWEKVVSMKTKFNILKRLNRVNLRITVVELDMC